MHFSYYGKALLGDNSVHFSIMLCFCWCHKNLLEQQSLSFSYFYMTSKFLLSVPSILHLSICSRFPLPAFVLVTPGFSAAPFIRLVRGLFRVWPRITTVFIRPLRPFWWLIFVFTGLMFALKKPLLMGKDWKEFCKRALAGLQWGQIQ